MDDLGRDLRHAWRRLRLAPVFVTFAILTLALGIGATTAIYSAVQAVLSPPSGITNADRLVRVTRTDGGSGPMMSLSWPEYQDFLQQQSVFDSVGAYHFTRVNVMATGITEATSSEFVSGRYFETLGVAAARGRMISSSDDLPGAAPVATISYRAWQRWFDGAEDAIGKSIKVNGMPFSIVGVAGPEFSGMFNGGVISTWVWIPFSAMRALPNVTATASFDPGTRDRRWIMLTGRVADGRTVAESQAEVAAIGMRLNTAYPDTDLPSRLRNQARPWVAKPLEGIPKILGADRVVGPLTTALMVAVVLVLLVACTNLANLMLARTSARAQELAVRRSLGASRLRLMREALAETVVIAMLGGLLAVAIARLMMVILGRELVITRGVALQLQPHLDLGILAAAGAATLLAMAIAGLAPALHAARVDERRALAASSISASPRWRGRRYLIAMQVAVSVLLVSIAGLCVAEVREYRSADTGIDFDRLALIDVDFRQPQYNEPLVREIVEGLLAGIGRQPGVTAVSVSSGLPSGISTPGAMVSGTGPMRTAELVAATPLVFETLGVDVTRGRGIDARDAAGSLPVVILGEPTAEALFGTTDVIGRTLTVRRQKWAGEVDWPAQERTIVGIARAAGHELVERRRGVIYVPWSQHYEDRLVFAVRSQGDPAALVGSIRQMIQGAAPDAAVTQSLTGEALLAQDVLFFQVVGAIATVLGSMALVVALAGLYGILSFLVAGRTREIGIRVAIGAGHGAIRRQILREGLSPILIGLVLGLGVGTLARLGMQPMFQRMVPAADLFVLALVPLLFIGAGLVASYLPARRASRVNPIDALRQL